MDTSSEFDDETRKIRGRLIYIIENCQIAQKELCRVNKELLEALDINSPNSPQQLGDLDRMIKDYVVIRVAGLFDEDNRAVSFVSIFRGNEKFESIKREKIIKEIINNRHKWVAHNDKDGEMISTATVCESNLGELLESMKDLLNTKNS